MVKVSVVIPTYNEAGDITQCLQSLAQQDYQDFEIVIVDDGSTDTTLSEIKASAVNVRVFHQAHKGAGAARNLGAKQARGGILVFIDGDMYFESNFISQLVKSIVKGRVIGTFSKDELLANKDNPWAVCWNLNRGLPRDRMHADSYPDKQKVFRAILKKEFDRVGGFNEKAGYTDDWSLSEKLGVEAQISSGAVFYHKNPGSLSEVFIQSKWMAKRRYKMGNLGLGVALVRVSLPVSLVMGVWLSLRYLLPGFVIFKMVSDLGQFVGIIEYALAGKVSK